MERRDKDSNPFIFDFAYSQITSYVPYPYLNLGIIFLQHFIFLAKFYDLVTNDHNLDLICLLLVPLFFIHTLSYPCFLHSSLHSAYISLI